MMAERRSVTIGDIFTKAEIEKAQKLFEASGGGTDKYRGAEFHRAVKEYVVADAMPRINKVLGQENDESYMSYVLEMVLSRRKKGG